MLISIHNLTWVQFKNNVSLHIARVQIFHRVIGMVEVRVFSRILQTKNVLSKSRKVSLWQRTREGL